MSVNPPAEQAYIGLGANQGHPLQTLQEALIRLDHTPHVRLLKQSSFYRTAPIGFEDQADFINAVALIETRLSPAALLDALLAIEHACGRVRSFRNAPRMLDLDVLLYGARSIDLPGLHVPHPRMHERAFVLAPLTELDPCCNIPGRGSAQQLLAHLGNQKIERLSS